MSTVLYEAYPSLVGMYPLGVVIGVLLIPVGVGILLLFYWYLLTKSDHPPIKSDEIVWPHGLINKQFTEINMSSVRTVRVTQSLIQRMLKAGDVAIYTAGDQPEVVIRGLPNPGDVPAHIKGQQPAEATK